MSSGRLLPKPKKKPSKPPTGDAPPKVEPAAVSPEEAYERATTLTDWVPAEPLAQSEGFEIVGGTPLPTSKRRRKTRSPEG